MTTALYDGIVTHKRLRPRAHLLRYRIFMLALDLDAGPALAKRLRLFGFDRPGLISFHQRDHGDGSPTGLRAWLEKYLIEAGLAPGGRIEALCMPRVLGHAFNPLTLFFCHAPTGGLQAILYEVNNTFGQRHAYLLRAADGAGLVEHECAKSFHVSPFLPMDMRYRFRVRAPGPRAAVFISVADTQGTVLAASFAGDAVPLTDRALALQLLRMPVLGLKILGAIHWEAAKLWLKGIKFLRTPLPPAQPVTIVP